MSRQIERESIGTVTAIAATPVRGLNRAEAARFIGISPSKFDELVRDGRMPKPKQIDGRRVWDMRALDRAFDELPGDDGAAPNPFDRDGG